MLKLPGGGDVGMSSPGATESLHGLGASPPPTPLSGSPLAIGGKELELEDLWPWPEGYWDLLGLGFARLRWRLGGELLLVLPRRLRLRLRRSSRPCSLRRRLWGGMAAA